MLCIGADGEQCHYINISEGLGVKLPNINRGGEMAGCTRLICNDVSPPPVCTNLEARCVRTCTRKRHTAAAMLYIIRLGPLHANSGGFGDF